MGKIWQGKKNYSKELHLKVPSGQIGSALEWYRWIGLDFVILVFNIWKKFFLYVHKQRSFPLNPAPNAGETTIVLRITAREWKFQHPAIQTKIVQSLTDFFIK
jgi:hypothetical protein